MSGGPGFYRGTTHEQTPYFANKEKKMIESKKWPSSFSKKVDISKVSLDVIQPWISKRITELLGVEDEIVINYCTSQLKPENTINDGSVGGGGVATISTKGEIVEIDPKILQINLTGFMAKNTSVFVQELWELLLSAQENPSGIPQQFLDEKKEEIRKRKDEQLRIQEELERRHNLIRADSNIENIKVENAVEDVSSAPLNHSYDVELDESRSRKKMREHSDFDVKAEVKVEEKNEKDKGKNESRRSVSRSSGNSGHRKYTSSESRRSVSRESRRRRGRYNRIDDRRGSKTDRRYTRDYSPVRPRHGFDRGADKLYNSGRNRYGGTYNRHYSSSRERSPYSRRRRSGYVHSHRSRSRSRVADRRHNIAEDTHIRKERDEATRDWKGDRIDRHEDRMSSRINEERQIDRRKYRDEREYSREARRDKSSYRRQTYRTTLHAERTRDRPTLGTKRRPVDASDEEMTQDKGKISNTGGGRGGGAHAREGRRGVASKRVSSSSSSAQRSSSSVSVSSSSMSNEKRKPAVKEVILSKKAATGRLRAWSPSSSNSSHKEGRRRKNTSRSIAAKDTFQNAANEGKVDKQHPHASNGGTTGNSKDKAEVKTNHGGRRRDSSSSGSSTASEYSNENTRSDKVTEDALSKTIQSGHVKKQHRTRSEEILRQKALGALKRKPDDESIAN